MGVKNSFAFLRCTFWQQPWAVLWVFLGAFVLCVSNIWGYPIFILDEAKNAQAASEMWASGDWFFPRFNGDLRTDKPPLHYFVMAGFYELFGTHVFASRLGSSLMGACTFALMYSFVRRYKGAKLAGLSTLALACSPLFIMEFHLAVPDPYFIFFVCLSLVGLFRFSQERKILWLLIFYIALGLSVLAKGPVAIGLVGLTAVFVLIYNKEFHLRGIWAYRPFLGGFLVILIAIPWFYFAHNATGGAFTQGFFIDHNINRFGSEMEGHGGIFLLTWLFVILGVLPFGFFLFTYTRAIFRTQKKDPFFAYALTVCAIWIGFFSISSTKLPNYTMPCYPFLVVLLAHVFLHAHDKARKLVFLGICGLTFLLPFAVVLAFHFGEPQLHAHRWVGVFFLPAFVGSFLAFRWHKKRRLFSAYVGLALGWITSILLLFLIAVPLLAEEGPAAVAKKTLPPSANLVVYKSYDPALQFAFARTFPQIESENELHNFLSESAENIALTKTKNFPEKQVPTQYKVLFRQKALFENYEMVAIQLK